MIGIVSLICSPAASSLASSLSAPGCGEGCLRSQSSRRTRLISTDSSSLLGSSYLTAHLPREPALSAILAGYQPPSLSTSTLSPLLHLSIALPGASIDQAIVCSGGTTTSSVPPPSSRAMHSLPDLPGSRAVAAHHASSCRM